MIRNASTFVGLTVLILAGCSKQRSNQESTGAIGDTAAVQGTGSSTYGGGRMTDTAYRNPSRADSDTMRGGARIKSDTVHPGMPMGTDTSKGGARIKADTHRTGIKDSMPDSTRGNQSKSGVTDTRTGKSTLGKGVTQTRPDQGKPVTSKGDTINPSVDSSTRGDTTHGR